MTWQNKIAIISENKAFSQSDKLLNKLKQPMPTPQMCAVINLRDGDCGFNGLK